MDSRTPVITSSTSTMHAYASKNLANDGPTVIKIPLTSLRMHGSVLSANGVTGPDKGKGGKYRVPPPGYQGEVRMGIYI